MSLSTLAVLGVIAVFLALAVRSMLKDFKSDHCGGCSSEECASRHAEGSCCSTAERMIADVEERLGPVARD